jgi:hypothetical protein
LVLSQLEDATIAVRTWWLAFAVLTTASSRAAMAGAQQTCRVSVQPIAVADLREASGIALSQKTAGLLWLHNDSGEPLLVAVGTDGGLRARIRVSGASVGDWEDIGVGPCSSGTCVYIADIGDNGANRRNVVIYRVAEPAADAEASSAAESMQLTYPDGARDAESMIVMPDGALFIVSKGERGPIAIYRVPGGFRSGTAVQLERVATIAEASGGERGLPRSQRITGGAASPDGRWIALRTLYSVTFYSASDFVRGDVREVLRFDVSGMRERQGEGIALGEGGAMWLASEGGGRNRPGTIARVDCPLK